MFGMRAIVAGFARGVDDRSAHGEMNRIRSVARGDYPVAKPMT